MISTIYDASHTGINGKETTNREARLAMGEPTITSASIIYQDIKAKQWSNDKVKKCKKNAGT